MAYLVQEDALVYEAPALTPLLTVETSAWYAWLEEVTHFTFQGQHGAFSARKERASHGRGGYYWRAYRKEKGKLRRVYLGKSEQLTMARLKAAAQKLAWYPGQGADARAKPRNPSAWGAAPASRKSREAAPVREIFPLMLTKLHIPAFQEQRVSRSHLIGCLNRGMKSRLILLSAAAGSGKTTLLGEWAHQSPMLVAWVSLDKEDNDPVRFWAYVLAGLRQASFHGVEHVLEMLCSRPLAPFQSILSVFINMLDEEAREIVIVLDDYHLIEAQAIHDTLVFFLEHLPAHVHLALASRYELPFSIAQFRAKRQLFELSLADLSFTLAEAERLFEQAEHLLLSREDLAVLLERTEGWITGLRLAALSLRSRQDVPGFLSSFKGDHRFLLSYLVDEVLACQPDDVRRFLLSTSVLEHFTASLCDALTGERNGKELLRYLEQKNLFLFPLDEEGAWYRYHHLLAEALSSHLRQEQPERFRVLHLLASAWYEQHDMQEEAVRHALVAADFERAADLLERLVEIFLKHNEFASVERWQKLLPADVLAKRPWLRLSWVSIFVASGLLDQAEEGLHTLEQLDSAWIEADAVDAFRGRVAALYAHLYAARGEARRALDCARQALDLLPEDNLGWRLSAQAAMGGAYLHGGKLIEAEQTLCEVITCSLQQHDFHRALTTLHTLGQTQTLLGRLDLANASYQRGIQIASLYGLTHSAVMGHIYAGLGDVFYEWNDLKAAEAYLVSGIELARHGANLIQALDCTLTLADVKLALGQTQEALAILRQAQELAHQTNDPFFLDFVTRRPVLLWLEANNVDAAVRCAQMTGLYHYGEVDDVASLPSTYFLLIELVMLARLYIAQGDLSRASSLLAQLQAPLAEGQNKKRRVQWLLLHALALHADHLLDEALFALAQALEMAEPMGYIRTFVDMGASLLAPLKALHNLKPLARYSSHYVRQLLSAMGEQDLEDRSDELLSEREWTVLRCLAEGYSDREIAEKLVLTENTIKTHTKHIYSKLYVHSRTQALARAKEQGLL